jgi:hypothetical protein
MVRGLHQKDAVNPESYLLRTKSQAETLELLGEPYKRSRGRGCQIGYCPEVEVWLYEIELRKANPNEVVKEYFHVYFSTDGEVTSTRIDELNPKRKTYLPQVG